MRGTAVSRYQHNLTDVAVRRQLLHAGVGTADALYGHSTASLLHRSTAVATGAFPHARRDTRRTYAATGPLGFRQPSSRHDLIQGRRRSSGRDVIFPLQRRTDRLHMRRAESVERLGTTALLPQSFNRRGAAKRQRVIVQGRPPARPSVYLLAVGMLGTKMCMIYGLSFTA